MSEAHDKLLEELRPLLDETTIISILSDYDLSNPQEAAAAREVLLTISADVFAEEATGFNPSGLGGPGDCEDDDDEDGQISSTAHGIGTLRLGASSDAKSSDDGHTTTSKGSRARTFSSSMASTTTTTTESMPQTPRRGGALQIDIFDGLGEAEKEHQLCDMFTSLKPIDITLALQKAHGNASAAIDHLLSLQLLEETGQRVKGVDGFYVPDDGDENTLDRRGSSGANNKKKQKKGGKGKGKGAKGRNKKGQGSGSGTFSPGSESPIVDDNEIIYNEGQAKRHEENIDLIAKRFQVSALEVSAIYHRRGSSPGATVHEILDNFLALDLPSTLTRVAAEVSIPQAQKKYPWVPEEFTAAVFEMTSHDDDADEMLCLLANDYFEKPAYLKYNVAYSVKASEPGLSDDESISNNRTITPLSPTRLHPQPNSLSTATSHTTHLASRRDHSRAAASNAFRMGRSNPLYRQAGAFYAERSRAEAAAQRSARSVEAGYLVDSRANSSSYGNKHKNVVDLHGTTVADGTSIALDRTWSWWEGLRDRCGGDVGLMARAIRDDDNGRGGGGLVVVTGLGRHNSDGRSALRNAVFKTLVGDGWKVEVLTGAFRVSGRASAGRR